MKANRSSLFRTQSRLSGALALSTVVLTMVLANAGTPAPAPAPAAPEQAGNWITLSLGGAFVDGNDAGMMRRTQTNGDFYGGISDCQYTRSLDDSTTFTLEGHALPGLEDYELGLLLNRENLGYLKLGYDQFRTWYDASGGYSALAGNKWVVPFDDEQHIDRGEFSLEAGLRMENLPEVTFRYSHGFRDGEKDSLAWGDNQVATRFKVVPSLWAIDEETDLFELDVTHTLGITDLGMGLVYEHSELSNTRTTPRGGATGYDSVVMREADESDLFAGNIHGVTRFNDQVWLSYAAAYTTMDSDMDGGFRSYAAPRSNAPGTRDYSYRNMIGGSKMDQFVMNVNLMWVPVTDLTITPALRYEHENLDTISQFDAYIDGGGNASNVMWQGLDSTPGVQDQALGSFTEKDATSGSIEVQYKGVENVVLYANALWDHEEEDVTRQDLRLPAELLASDIEIDDQEYTLGANWYPLSQLSFGIQGLYGLREQSFDHFETDQSKANTAAGRQMAGGANNLRPLMVEHNVEVSDFNLRMNWRPMGNLSLVTRYDYCDTQYENRGIQWTAPTAPTILNIIESGSVKSNILSETVTWSPMARLFLQGSVSWVSSETNSPVAGTTPGSDNDYVTCGVSAGYAIDDKTDVTAAYNYYGMSNYAVAASALGYGYNTDEHAISLTLTRMLSDNMLWNLSYGFITSNTDGTDQTGGFNDFDAHMISTGLQIRF
jgi:hypothetical protein